jgi:hypothetical protein
VFLLSWLSTYVVFYLVSKQPFKEPNDTKIEVFNEVCLMFLLDQAFEMTEQFDGVTRYRQALYFIFCFLALFFSNMLFAIWNLSLY